MKLTDYNKLGQPAQNTQSSDPITGAIRGGSNLLRDFGLGAIPTIGSGVFEAGRAGLGALQGENAYKSGGAWGVDNNGQGQIQDPFMSDKQLSNYSTPMGAAKEAVGNTAGLASWAIPMGKGAELGSKLIPGVSKGARIAQNVLGNSLAGAGVSGLQTLSQPGATPQSTASNMGLGALINNLIPGAAGTLKLAGKGPNWLAGNIGKTVANVNERKAMPAIDVIQQAFGGRGVSTEGDRALAHPDLEALLKEHNITLPPGTSPDVFLQQMKAAQPKVQAKLEPLLKNESATVDNIRNIIKQNISDFAPNDRKFLSSLPPKVQDLVNTNANNIDLNTLNEAVKSLGKVANFGGQNLTAKDQFAQETWKNLKDLMSSELDKSSNASVKQLNGQHEFLLNGIKNTNTYRKNGYPDGWLSKSLAEMKRATGGLSSLRENELAMRTLGAGAITGTQFIPGIPEPLKLALQAAEASVVAPYAIPELGPAMQKAWGGVGSALQKPANSPNLMKVLQQLGVRLPGMIGQ